MSRRPLPPGRSLGNTISFPVNVSSRAFRCASSTSRFPLSQLDGNSIKLKDLPIHFCWKPVGEDARQAEWKDPISQKASTTTNGIHGGPSWSARDAPVRYDPHRTGYGRIPSNPPRVRSPPPCLIEQGILGVDPRHRTRGKITRGCRYLRTGVPPLAMSRLV